MPLSRPLDHTRWLQRVGLHPHDGSATSHVRDQGLLHASLTLKISGLVRQCLFILPLTVDFPAHVLEGQNASSLSDHRITSNLG